MDIHTNLTCVVENLLRPFGVSVKEWLYLQHLKSSALPLLLLQL